MPDAPGEADFASMGKWSELPLPEEDGEELGLDGDDRPTDGGAWTRMDTLNSPISKVYRDLLDMVRGDAYVLWMGGAALAMILLALALFALT